MFKSIVSASALMLVLGASPVIAGSNNKAFFTQDSGASGVGNTLMIDQSAANGSLLAGSSSDLSPARQSGGGNTADLTFEGQDVVVVLNQDNAAGNPLGNDATIFAQDAANVLLDQDGFGNSANISVTGAGSRGVLLQDGDNNQGSVFVSGIGSIGELRQLGDRNNGGVSVTSDDTTVVFIQNGSDLSPVTTGAIDAPAVPEVFSNAGGTITITQTPFVTR